MRHLWLLGVVTALIILRTWFGHDPQKFAEFRHRYEAELASEAGQSALWALRDLARQGLLTLVFAAHDVEYTNAVVLRDLLASNDLSNRDEQGNESRQNREGREKSMA